jgi:hypothetical protein
MARHTRRVCDLELVARCDDAFAPQAGSLLEAVASFEGEGKGLADGVTVRFGWSLLTLRRRRDEVLVCEPDFDGDPFRDLREDVTCTLAVLAGQAAVVNRLGVEPAEARFDEKVVLARGCLAERRVYLQRSEPRPFGPRHDRFDPGRYGSYFQTPRRVAGSLARVRGPDLSWLDEHDRDFVRRFEVLLEECVAAGLGLYVTF